MLFTAIVFGALSTQMLISETHVLVKEFVDLCIFLSVSFTFLLKLIKNKIKKTKMVITIDYSSISSSSSNSCNTIY